MKLQDENGDHSSGQVELPANRRLCRNWVKGQRILRNGTDRRVRKL